MHVIIIHVMNNENDGHRIPGGKIPENQCQKQISHRKSALLFDFLARPDAQ